MRCKLIGLRSQIHFGALLTRSLHKSSCRSGLLAANRAGDGAPTGCVSTSLAVNSRINSKRSFHLVEQAAKSAFRPGITQLSG